MREFIQALMLGSSRLSAPPAAPHPLLTEAWSTLPWTDSPETALLDATALVGTAGVAGRKLANGAEPPAQSIPEPLSPVGPAAAALVSRLLTTEFRSLLGEWLEQCASVKRVVPPFFLPRLLDAAEGAERSALGKVCGERGRWLARLNPRWLWLLANAEMTDSAAWETGTSPERLACLRRWRAVDPATGRDRLRQTWETEPPEFRLEALEILATGLSREDEEFLEPLLADRRKDIRQQAQALLASLPDSTLAGRLEKRAESWLLFKRGLLSKRLEVVLPSAFDPVWKADALEEKPPAGTGEKAFWVQQVLSRIPVQHWCATFSLAPDALIKLSRDGEWAELLLGAWFRSVLLHRDGLAAAALFPVVIQTPRCLPAGTSMTQALVSLLAICHEQNRWELLEKHGAEHGLAWSWLREISNQPGPAASRVLLALLTPALRDGVNPGGSPQAVLAARWISPELRPEVENRLQREQGFSKPAEAFLQALELRAVLRAAFLSPSP